MNAVAVEIAVAVVVCELCGGGGCGNDDKDHDDVQTEQLGAEPGRAHGTRCALVWPSHRRGPW